jgi:ankyrin repeat protein
VQALIEFDKKMINAANNFGTTPLHLAVYAGKTATAAFLLKHGASPNACDKAKVTPIHNAVARGPYLPSFLRSSSFASSSSPSPPRARVQAATISSGC